MSEAWGSVVSIELPAGVKRAIFMFERDLSKVNKLEFVVNLLFSLPPKDVLPIFRRLSLDDMKKVLNQLKQQPPETLSAKSKQRNSYQQKMISSNSHRHSDLSSSNQGLDKQSPLSGIDFIMRFNESEIKTVLRNCDTSFWAPALNNASRTVQCKIMDCMAPAASGLLKVEIEQLGKINLKREQLAYEGILQTVHRLAKSGQIALNRPVSEAA